MITSSPVQGAGIDSSSSSHPGKDDSAAGAHLGFDIVYSDRCTVPDPVSWYTWSAGAPADTSSVGVIAAVSNTQIGLVSRSPYNAGEGEAERPERLDGIVGTLTDGLTGSGR
jgi:hypothetical protein